MVHDWEVVASKLSIHGTSTIHDWEIIAEKIAGTAEIEITTDQIFKITSMQIEIPVINLKNLMNIFVIIFTILVVTARSNLVK